MYDNCPKYGWMALIPVESDIFFFKVERKKKERRRSRSKKRHLLQEKLEKEGDKFCYSIGLWKFDMTTGKFAEA